MKKTKTSKKEEKIIRTAHKRYDEIGKALSKASNGPYTVDPKYRWFIFGDLGDLRQFYAAIAFERNFEKALELMWGLDTLVREEIPISIYNYLDKSEWMNEKTSQ